MRSMSVPGALAVVCAGLMWAPAAQSTGVTTNCNVRGPWDFRQTNGAVVNVDLSQSDDGRLEGAASTADNRGLVMTGRIVGRVVQFTIRWTSGPAGMYLGFIDPKGDKIAGMTIAENDSFNYIWRNNEKSFFGCPNL